MSKTETDVAQDLKSRFMGHIKTIETEYAWQVAKWEPFFDIVGDAQGKACDNFKSTIKEAIQDVTRGAELVLMALSMAGGAAIGWLGTMVKAKLTTTFAKSPIYQDAFVPGAGYEIVKVSGGTLDETAAKAAFFGDKLEKGLGSGFDKLVAKMTPKIELKNLPRPASQTLKTTMAQSIQKADYASFKTAIKAVFTEEIQLTTAQFGLWHATTNNNQTFGQELLAAVKAKFKNPKMPAEQLEMHGINEIDDYIDKLRQQFAKDWFYYANDPDSNGIRYLHEKIEKELWAMWIIDQEFKVTRTHPMHPPAARGKDKIPLNHRIIKHLLVNMGATGQDMIDLEYKLQRGFWDGGPIGEALAPNLVDTEDDLKVVTAWAKRHPGRYTGGQIGFKPRIIGTIRKPETIFVGAKVPKAA